MTTTTNNGPGANQTPNPDPTADPATVLDTSAAGNTDAGIEDVVRYNPAQLARLREQLRSALVADALDTIGLRNQCLSPGFSPLRPGDVMVGHAFPVTITEVNAVPEQPYVGLLKALDHIGSGDVFVAATNGAPHVAIWGELVTTACMAAGAVGAVCDGHARDTAALRQLNFPVMCRGTVPYDSNGRSEIMSHTAPVTIDGVLITAGDLVVADDDGVVVVPVAHIVVVVEAALDKNGRESRFRTSVQNGMRPSEAFAEHGVL